MKAIARVWYGIDSVLDDLRNHKILGYEINHSKWSIRTPESLIYVRTRGRFYLAFPALRFDQIVFMDFDPNKFELNYARSRLRFGKKSYEISLQPISPDLTISQWENTATHRSTKSASIRGVATRRQTASTASQRTRRARVSRAAKARKTKNGSKT